MFRRVFASSRYLIASAVLGTFVAALTVIVTGLFAVGELAWEALRHPRTDEKQAKEIAVRTIELIDVFLLGTVLYIVALGLYELFVDQDLPLPPWLVFKDLDDLKGKLISVVVVVLGVLFLGQAVTWDGERDLLRFGAAIALVIAALTFFVGRKTGPGGER